MADARGLQINKDIFLFEEFIYALGDKLPKTFRYSTLHRLLEEHVIEMRHYTNLACRTPKWNKKEKVTLFSMASGFALDVADDLDHEYNRHWLTDKGKARADLMLDGIRAELSKLINAMSREIDTRQSARSTQSAESAIFKRSDNCQSQIDL
jgi:hypothetical protein